jgi:hypothetical protein
MATISERLARLFTWKIFSKGYWYEPFPKKYHDECFLCSRTDCSAKTCDKNLGHEKKEVSDRLIKNGLM